MKLTPKAGLTARPEPQADKLAANVPQKPVRLRPAPITLMQIIVRNTLIYKPAPSEQTTTPVILDAITVVINVMERIPLQAKFFANRNTVSALCGHRKMVCSVMSEAEQNSAYCQTT